MFLQANAQKKWDGEGGDGQWSNRLNWDVDVLPVLNDEVLLDNSLMQGTYQVILPAGNILVTVKNITITPSGNDSIWLILPSTNTAVPGLSISGPGYGLVLNDKAVFKNVSGASSGAAVFIGDSIRINHGGKYIHQTARSHSGNVSLLSRAPGTEEGIFEFDIPEASGTISLSDRVFGMLELSSKASKGMVNYTAAGTKGLKIRSDFVIHENVVLSLNFSDTFFIQRNFIQFGGTLNCGTTARSLVIAITGDFQQQGGSITESGTGFPWILFNGGNLQRITARGNIINSVSIMLRSGGCLLISPLFIPYKLSLLKGSLKTADSALLTLMPGSSLQADTINMNSFVEGPMLKQGIIGDFLFPVGRGSTMRWMAVKNYRGDLLVDFVKSNPSGLSRKMGPGLHHISSIEYWKIGGDPFNAGKMELSFDNVNSGGVTELSTLRVAKLNNDQWEDMGNSATTGNAGGSGSVVSVELVENATGTRYFTLAATNSNQNPLPLQKISLQATVVGGHIQLQWHLISADTPFHFEVEASRDGIRYSLVATIPFQEHQLQYLLPHLNNSSASYFRIKVVMPSSCFYSNQVFIPAMHLSLMQAKVYPAIAREQLIIQVKSDGVPAVWRYTIVDIHAKGVWKIGSLSTLTSLDFPIDVSFLPSGMYMIIIENKRSRKAIPFIKQS